MCCSKQHEFQSDKKKKEKKRKKRIEKQNETKQID